MNLLQKIKTNRLKAVSVFAVAGDIFMGMAGGEGLILRDSAHALSYSLLMASGSIALFGHLLLFVWGKGARDEEIPKDQIGREPSIFLKPFFPWRYPLDSALFAWLAAGTSYTVSGLLILDLALIFMGITNMAACLVGWLYPKDKNFLGFSGMQMTSLLYFLSTACTFWSAWNLSSGFIFLAACAFAGCNAILYTINKENQSGYTQKHEG